MSDVATNLSDAIPRWAVIPLVIIICLFLAAIIVGSVSVAGHFCGCRAPPPSPRHLEQQIDLREIGESIRSHNVSRDTVALAAMQSPPPVYLHPPQYGASFMEADVVERGKIPGLGGNSQVAA